jgi:predicted outer membrane repeat protein
MNHRVLLASAILLLAFPAHARTWRVPGNAATIQGGINLASAGDTVLVGCGSYYENSIAMKDGVTLRSETGEPECVTIDGGTVEGVLSMNSLGSTTRVEGLTIRNGARNEGGAIYCTGASPMITDCRLIANQANRGGAVYCASGSSPVLTRCVFVENHAYDNMAGTVQVTGSSSPVIQSCTFVANLHGRALSVDTPATVTIDKSIFALNEGREPIYAGSPSCVTLTCTDIVANQGGDWVGAIASQRSINGNLSTDPRFWNKEAGDFRLGWCSPCADAPGCGLIGALGLGPLGPRVVHVPADAPTIQAGIDICAPCDSVIVSAGTYHETEITMKSGIVLMGETGDPSDVIVDAQNQARVFRGEDLSPSTRIEGIKIAHGVDGYVGGGFLMANCYAEVVNCAFSGNSASFYGGGAYCDYGAPIFRNCLFTGNSAEMGAAIYTSNLSLTVIGSTIVGNSAASGGAMTLGGSATIESCTVAGNGGSPQINNEYWLASFTMTNSIVAFGEDAGVHFWLYGSLSFTCCDIYGHGTNWGSGLEGFLGVDGNISLDPEFCDLAGGNVHLMSSASPCAPHTAPNWECELIGSLPVGCDWDGLSAIHDVPNDQGRQAFVTWHSSPFDQANTPYTITEYSLWRRIDAPGKSSGGDDDSVVKAPGASVTLQAALRYPPGDWAFVATVPASGEAEYTTVAPTLCDSTIADGMCWSAFFVRAHTDNPLVFFDCAPDSGYSVDNLAPSPPGNLHFQDPSVLAWNQSGDPDFDYFTVYGADASEFDPQAAERIGSTSGTSMEITGTGFLYYHVTTTDFSGNEGGASTVSQTSGVGTVAPEALFLGQALPNPFQGVTVITYGIPAGAQRSPVTVKVFDATGRVVRTLVGGDKGPGTYRVTWTGTDDRGAQLSSGAYFSRIEWNGRTETERMLLLK